jgi:hypothetical protein
MRFSLVCAALLLAAYGASESGAAQPSKPDGYSVEELKLLEAAYVDLNRACRGGSGDSKLTYIVCNKRKAVSDMLMTVKRCYDERRSLWRACTSEESGSYAEYSSWYEEGGPPPAGTPPTSKYLQGHWAIFDNLTDPWGRTAPTSCGPFLTDLETLRGSFLHPTGGVEPTLVIPWSDDLMLVTAWTDEERGEDGPLTASHFMRRCA